MIEAVYIPAFGLISATVAFLLGRNKQLADSVRSLTEASSMVIVQLRAEVTRLAERVTELERINAELLRRLHLRGDHNEQL
jgi:hypothetical protein